MIVAARRFVDVPREQVREVDVEELVAVQRVDGAGFAPLLRGETKASAPSERLRLADQHELDAEVPELLLEDRFLARGAADQHTLDARLGEQSDLVRGQRAAPDRDERLGPALGCVAEPLGLSAGEDDRLHGRLGELVLGLARLGQPRERRGGPADAFIREAGLPDRVRIEDVPPVDDQRVPHRVANLRTSPGRAAPPTR